MRGSYHNMRVLLALMAPLATVQQSTLSPLFQTLSPVLTTTTTVPVFATTTTAPVLTTATVAPVQNPAITTATSNPTLAVGNGTTPSGWSGCDDPAALGEPILIGKKTTICVVLSNNVDWNPGLPATRYLRLSFQPIADEYSRFHVPSSYKDLVVDMATNVGKGQNNVTLHVASQKSLSFQRIFYDPNGGSGRVYPYLTAIINLRKGIVDGITWDDACLFCSDDLCLENTYDFNGNPGTQQEFGQPTKGCYITQPECASYLLEGEPRCDVTVQVVWTGEDANGRAMQSSAFRFSAFPEQELANRLSDSLPDIPEFFAGGGATTAPAT